MRIILIFLLFCFCGHSQIGGRLREKANQHKLRRHIYWSGWPDRKWVPNKLRRIELDRKIFYRYVTRNGRIKERIQRKINKDRARRRMRSRNSFSRRKYF